MGVCFVASLAVLVLEMDRSQRADEAIEEITSKWSREQIIHGPVITVPVRRLITTNAGQQTVQEDLLILLPNTLRYDATLEAETRSRGIFDAVVYTSKIKGSGTFDMGDLDLGQVDGVIQWDNAKLFIGIPDTRGIESSAELHWNEEKHAFEPGIPVAIGGASGIHAPVRIQQNKKEHSFSFDISLRGSQGMHFVPLGKTTDISLSSNWPLPSFTGEFLPDERDLAETGFTAKWTVSSFGRSLPQSWVDSSTTVNKTIRENIEKSTFGVSLLQEVNFYTEVDRAVKYSILFIVLTFLTFFMFEILSHLRIHPLNYLLIGLAIALFYVLLLSLSEHIGFLAAYSVSTLAITGLITGYSRSVLGAKKRAGIIAVLLVALYSYLYILLQLDELSLVFGSVFLFGILAIVMYITRDIDWYSISER